jgi:DNA-binding response OmpR family regulator
VSQASGKVRRTILVVEDDEVTRTLVERALSMTHDVRVAVDGVEAMAAMQRAPTPDLVICDVMMPKADGFHFVEAMKHRKEFERVPVVFLTAKTHPLDVVRGINAGARHYITKPFKIQDLVAKIDKILG